MAEPAMNRRERVMAAISGDPVDHPPVSLWRHFPELDQTADDLTATTLTWQRDFGFDFVKFMPSGDYPIIDWGGESSFQGAPGGTRQTTKFPVTKPEDWTTLPPIDVQKGFNGVMLDAVRQTHDGLPPDVPLLQTVFSPLTIAAKLCDGLVVEHLRAHPQELHEGLRRITVVARDMIAASLAAGADGLFFATQQADFGVLDETEYLEFGLPYDLEALVGGEDSAITMLHLHGENPMFAIQARYPANVINWHDRRTAPALAEGEKQSGRCVCGGVNEKKIAGRSPGPIAAEARDAVEQTGGRHLLVGPGCVIPVATPAVTLRAVVSAVAEAGSA